MKTFFISIAALLLVGALASRFVNAGNHCERKYPLEQVNEILFDVYGEVEIRQGDRNELIVKSNYIDFDKVLKVKSVNGKLTVRDMRPETIELTLPHVWQSLSETNADSTRYILIVQNPKSIELNGYLNAKIHKIKNPNLNISFSGAGSLNLQHMQQKDLQLTANGNIQTSAKDVNAEQARYNINGRGAITFNNTEFGQLSLFLFGSHYCLLKGSSDQFNITMEGRGKCSASNFITSNANVGLKGKSELILEVNDQLFATTQDESHMSYYGAPEITHSEANITSLASNRPTHMYF